ncbi:MAG: hypothetical protein ABJ246_13960 [Paracoccaceae bacterium]
MAIGNNSRDSQASYWPRIDAQWKRNKFRLIAMFYGKIVVQRGGETSNTNIDVPSDFLPTSNQDLTAVFETLQEWEDILSTSDINFEELGL